ncbi:HlyD family secretion protein [Pseudomonas vlassakiae]|uniref:HlyD family secretion protein n=1 Tax=Pseudomonas vlassakiae TaxID=485888 RepID=A0A923GKE6_9PSED|nr:HlyD family secretion protein [Pseudomonas vlassakiae]MBV4543074.1 HlyD family secretion protein [Pseudomonas vlassakiae]
MNASVDAPIDSAQAAPPTGERAKARNKRLKLAALVFAIALAVAFFGHWWAIGRFLQSTDDAYVGADVTVISTKVPGYIKDVAVADNQFVKAGDLLVRIEASDYRAALAKADGAVAAQRASLANLDATEQLQHSLISQAKAQLQARQAQTERALQDKARAQVLLNSHAVSLENAQHADAVWKTAQAEQNHAAAGVLAAQQQLVVIETQREQARAALAQAEAAREQAGLDVGYTELRSPVDGYIGNRRAKVGAYAAAGSQVVSVVPARGLWVDANFKEDQLARLRVGQPARIEADILPGRVFHGRVESIAPATGAQFSILPPENATGNFTKIVQRVPVRILLQDSDAEFGVLRPGLSVITEVDSHADSLAPAAPDAAREHVGAL